MGSLGKSSLAARIASRMSGHRTVVVFRRYDALSVLDRLLEAVPPQARMEARDTWREPVLADPGLLAEALEALLEGPLDVAPLLLIVDDLEAILETPAPAQTRTPVQAAYRAPLAAILSAFARAQTDSRLLLTSRYRFTLPDGRAGDLADGLTPVPLQTMDAVERQKQLWAAARTAQRETLSRAQERLLARALAAAGGNPGLQATLTTPILSGENQAAEQALAAIEHYRRTGTPPEAIQALLTQGAAKDPDNAVLAFFRRMAFQTYRAALSADQARMLGAACLFAVDLPIPRPALEAAGAAAGVADPGAALERLLGLGLADDWGQVEGRAQAAVNPLARSLAEPPQAGQAALIGAAALPPLAAAWQRSDGTFTRDARALELTRLALAAPAPDPDLLDGTAEAAARWLYGPELDARRAQETVLGPSLDRLAAAGAQPSHGLPLIAADCAERIGDTKAQERALALMQSANTKGADAAGTSLYVARREHRLGNLASAAESFAAAAEGFEATGQAREWAIACGGIADILQARGQLDEALALHEGRLSVFEQMGDIEGIAHVRFSTARIRLQRGDHQSGGLQQVYEDLSESFAILKKLGGPDGIGAVGLLLARVLTMGGQADAARQVLDEAEAAFETLGHAGGVEQIRALRARSA